MKHGCLSSLLTNHPISLLLDMEMNDHMSAENTGSASPSEETIPGEVAPDSLPLPWTPIGIAGHDMHSFDCNTMSFSLGQSSQVRIWSYLYYSDDLQSLVSFAFNVRT